MVKGIDTFREHFSNYMDCYIVIGGVACNSHFEEEGLSFRATKDVDVILVVEAINADFIREFWEFIKEGEYEQRQVSEDGRRYYRFIKPQNESYPMQLELFSKKPDLIPEIPGMTITPIPADEELSSLSAILMDEAYYQFTISHSREVNGVSMAESEALVCLEAKAFLDLSNRKEAGEKIDSRNIAKHRNDVFRLAAILRGDTLVETPESIKRDSQAFVELMEKDTPDLKAIFKMMGISSSHTSCPLSPENVDFSTSKDEFGFDRSRVYLATGLAIRSAIYSPLVFSFLCLKEIFIALGQACLTDTKGASAGQLLEVLPNFSPAFPLFSPG